MVRYGYLTGLDEIDISLEGADFLNSSQVAQVRHGHVTRDNPVTRVTHS